MEKEYRINIATALNSKYMRYAYVMMTSLLENQTGEAEVHMYFLHNDLTVEDQNQLSSLLALYGGYSHWICIARESIPAECPVTESWPLEIYYRLFLAEVMPEDIDRILYLDVDIIINHPLKELYLTEFEGNLFCVCENPGKYPFFDCRDDIFREHIQNKFRYFNSGVLLVNLKMLRKKYCFKDYMDTAEKLGFKLLAPDQDLLNYMHWKEVKFLEALRYNMFAKVAYNQGMHYEDARQTVTVLHYSGTKPWEGQYVHYDIEEIWWDYAKKTPFYFEMMEEFLETSISDPTVYDTMLQLHEEKKLLKEELEKSSALCKKLVQMLQK